MLCKMNIPFSWVWIQTTERKKTHYFNWLVSKFNFNLQILAHNSLMANFSSLICNRHSIGCHGNTKLHNKNMHRCPVERHVIIEAEFIQFLCVWKPWRAIFGWFDHYLKINSQRMWIVNILVLWILYFRNALYRKHWIWMWIVCVMFDEYPDVVRDPNDPHCTIATFLHRIAFTVLHASFYIERVCL